MRRKRPCDYKFCLIHGHLEVIMTVMVARQPTYARIAYILVAIYNLISPNYPNCVFMFMNCVALLHDTSHDIDKDP